MAKDLIKYCEKWVKKHWKLLIILLFFMGLYGIPHELAHAYAASQVGYEFELNLIPFLAKTHYPEMDQSPPSMLEYYAINIAPYVLSTVLLFVLLLVQKQVRKPWVAYAATIPFSNILFNVFGMFRGWANPSDFLTLFDIALKAESYLLLSYILLVVLSSIWMYSRIIADRR